MPTDRWMGACALLIALTTTIVAAVDAPAAQDKPARQAITGCLQGPLPTDEYSVSLRPDAASNTSGTSTYRMTNVMTKGTPAGTSNYVVVGTEKQMTAHLGHQVEVVGTTIAAPAGRPNTEPALRVESVKMVAEKCAAPAARR